MDKPLALFSGYRYIWEQLDNNLDSLYVYIQDYPYVRMDNYGNIVAANTDKHDTCAVFCCHLDTVHKLPPELEVVKEDILLSLGGGGVGGDDKCGVVACLEMLRSAIPCKCIFFRDEEKGCLGSREFDAKSLKDNMFCIEIDRRNSNDLIFSASGRKLCSKEFQDRVKAHFPHGKPESGMLTDVCVLEDADINMMNLSSGYYRPHTDKEYVVLSELHKNIECLKNLTKDLMANPLSTNKYKRRSSYGYYGNYQKTGSAGYGQSGAIQQSLYDRDAEDYLALQYGERFGSTPEEKEYKKDTRGS